MAVESYLGCGSLKVGGVVTGILSLITPYLAALEDMFLVMVVCLWVYNGSLIYLFIDCIRNLNDQDDNYTVLQVLFTVMIVLSLLHSTISIFLLNAVFMNKQDLLLMWVVVYTSSMIVGVFFTIGLSCMNSPYLAFLLLGYVVFMYHTMVVHSLYYKTQEKIEFPERELMK